MALAVRAQNVRHANSRSLASCSHTFTFEPQIGIIGNVLQQCRALPHPYQGQHGRQQSRRCVPALPRTISSRTMPSVRSAVSQRWCTRQRSRHSPRSPQQPHEGRTLVTVLMLIFVVSLQSFAATLESNGCLMQHSTSAQRSAVAWGGGSGVGENLFWSSGSTPTWVRKV